MENSNTLYKYSGGEDLFYRQFFIKKKNGRHRRICAPSPNLLAFQRRNLHHLEEIFEQKIHSIFAEQDRDIFHGFLKNRNIVTCARKHIGFDSTICLDISNCFDTITKEMLNNSLLDDKLFHEDGSLAQGLTYKSPYTK